jgi:hypothetical protein
MNKPIETQDGLERLFNRTLNELPPRRAPPTLESRVIGELDRRAALAWWRRSFAYWPRAARAVFVAICGGLIGLAFLGGAWVTAGLRLLQDSGALSMPWLHQAAAVAGFAGELTSWLAIAVPPVWLYDGVAVSALLYAALFGLGVAAYRTLYLDSGTVGDIGP